MRMVKRWWWLLLVVPVLLPGGFAVWVESTLRPMPQALEALATSASRDQVIVNTNNWIVFRPTDLKPATGLVFCAAGRVDARSYAHAGRPGSGGGHRGFAAKAFRDTDWVTIEEGYHTQFGWYGRQGGNNPATISRQEQQRMGVAGTVDLLESLPIDRP